MLEDFQLQIVHNLIVNQIISTFDSLMKFDMPKTNVAGCLVCITLFFSAFAFGQSKEEKRLETMRMQMQRSSFDDSLKLFQMGAEFIQLAKQLNKEAEIGYVYQYYGTYFYFSNNLSKARAYYKKSIDFGERMGNEKQVLATKIRENYLDMDDNIPKAEKVFKNLLAQSEKGKYLENQIVIHNGLGILYESTLKDKEAIQSYLRGLKIAEKGGFKYETGFLLNNLGLLKIKHKNYQSAKKDLERALILAKEVQQSRLILNITTNLGIVNKQVNNLKASIQYYHQTVIEAKKIGFPYGISASYLNLGSTYLENTKFELASRYADSSLFLAQKYGMQELISNASILRASAYIYLKKFTEAKLVIDEIKAIQALSYNPTIQVKLYEVESLLAAETNDYKTAYSISRKLSNLKDSIEIVTNESEQNRLQAIFNKERTDNELKDLHQRNKILKGKNELKEANMRLIFLIAVVALILVFTASYIMYNRKSRKIKTFFSQKLIEQIDEERSRISNDLHDDIGQSLAIIKSKVNLFTNSKISRLDGLEHELGDLIERTRVISHQLHPSALEKIGIKQGLISLLDRTQDATNLICSIDFEMDEHEIRSEHAAQLYRIIQECISNTIRHANATALKVIVEKQGGSIVIQYRDNGIGMSTIKYNSGLGLLTIRERVSIIGGKLDLRTGNKKGVTLTITL